MKIQFSNFSLRKLVENLGKFGKSSSPPSLNGLALLHATCHRAHTQARKVWASRKKFEIVRTAFFSKTYIILAAFVTLRWRRVFCLPNSASGFEIVLYFARSSCIRMHFKLSEFLSSFRSPYSIYSSIYSSAHQISPIVTLQF